MKKRVVIFASGDRSGGGSGFQELVENSRTGVLTAEVVAVVSQHPEGGVRRRADALGIPFILFPRKGADGEYRRIVEEARADFVLLSGWLFLVVGLDPKTTINIHPGPLPESGGTYGHYVHEAVLRAFRRNEIRHSAVSMHFVTPRYDEGPVFFRYPILIRPDDTPETLQARVNKIEHGWQSFVTNLVVTGEIHWDGKNPQSLSVPPWYQLHLPSAPL